MIWFRAQLAAAPAAAVGTGGDVAKHPAGRLNDHAALFQHRNELPGRHQAAVRRSLFAEACGGVVETDRYTPGRPLHLGLLPADVMLPVNAPPHQRSRNNAVLAAALAEPRAAIDAAIARFGPGRVAVILGVSTSGVEEGERASRLWQAGTRLVTSLPLSR